MLADVLVDWLVGLDTALAVVVVIVAGAVWFMWRVHFGNLADVHRPVRPGSVEQLAPPADLEPEGPPEPGIPEPGPGGPR